jgi:hypothetical protein
VLATLRNGAKALHLLHCEAFDHATKAVVWVALHLR